MDILRKRILVTGGAGFIGSHLCERLLHEGNDVLCVDDTSEVYGDAARAASELGWRTRQSGIDDIVDSAWHWRNLYHNAGASKPSVETK